jgi:hypothetical protein
MSMVVLKTLLLANCDREVCVPGPVEWTDEAATIPSEGLMASPYLGIGG